MDFSALETWGYLAVAFFGFGGSFVIVIAAAIFSYLGHMSLPIALGVAAFANFMGDNFLFYLARYHRKEVMPYFKKHRRKLELANLIMRKYGVWAIFIQKFIYGVKTLVPLVMGMSKYSFVKFVIFNFFASILFVLALGLGAYYASESFIAFYNIVKERPYLAPLILFAILGSVWWWMQKMTAKRT